MHHLSFAVSSPEKIKYFMDICSTGQEGLVQLAIAVNPDLINAKDQNGEQTALMAAITAGQTKIAQILIYNHADVNSQDSNGITPLMYATLWGNTKIAQSLINHNADINTETYVNPMKNNPLTDTAMTYAIKYDRPDIIKIIKKKSNEYSIVSKIKRWVFSFFRKNPIKKEQCRHTRIIPKRITSIYSRLFKNNPLDLKKSLKQNPRGVRNALGNYYMNPLRPGFKFSHPTN